jgi:hypothetical protein
LPPSIVLNHVKCRCMESLANANNFGGFFSNSLLTPCLYQAGSPCGSFGAKGACVLLFRVQDSGTDSWIWSSGARSITSPSVRLPWNLAAVLAMSSSLFWQACVDQRHQFDLCMGEPVFFHPSAGLRLPRHWPHCWQTKGRG